MKFFSAIMVVAVATRCSVASPNLDSTISSFQTRAISHSDDQLKTSKESTPISITTSTQKVFQKKVSKRHALGLKDENAQIQEQGTEKPSQKVIKTEETKDKTNDKETSVTRNEPTSTSMTISTQKTFKKLFSKRHEFGQKDENSHKQEQGTEKPNQEFNKTKDKFYDKETSITRNAPTSTSIKTSTQKTLQTKVSKRHASGQNDEDSKKQNQGTGKPSQEFIKTDETKDKETPTTRNGPTLTPITTSTQKTLKKTVFKTHAFGQKDADSQKQEQRTKKPSQEFNEPDETKEKTNDKKASITKNGPTSTFITTSTQKTLGKIVSKRHAFGQKDEESQKQDGTEKPSNEFNKPDETKDKTNDKETSITWNRPTTIMLTSISITTSTQKTFQKQVFKRHTFEKKDEESQKQEQETEKSSQEVNKTEEIKDTSNEKLSKGLQNNAKEELKGPSEKLSSVIDLASKVHVKEDKDEKRKKNIFAKLNDQVNIGKHIIDSAKEVNKQKIDKAENSELKKYTLNNKNYFIGPNKKISTTDTQTLSDNRNNIVFGLDKLAEENTYGIELSGRVRRNVNMQTPIKKINHGVETVQKTTDDNKSSFTDVPDFIGDEVERLGDIIEKTDENKKNEGMKSMKGSKIETEQSSTPKAIKNNKNAGVHMRAKAKNAVSETKRHESIDQVVGSKQVKADGKQTNLGDMNPGVEKILKEKPF